MKFSTKDLFSSIFDEMDAFNSKAQQAKEN